MKKFIAKLYHEKTIFAIFAAGFAAGVALALQCLMWRGLL